MGTPRPMPCSARRGGVVVIGQVVRPGRGHSAHAGAGSGFRTSNSPRSWLVHARRGGREDTRQARCPGCGWSAGEGGRALHRQQAPAVAGLRTLGRWRSYLALAPPGRCHTMLAGEGWRSAGKQLASVAAGSRTLVRLGGYRAGRTPRLWPVRAGWGCVGPGWRPGRG